MRPDAMNLSRRKFLEYSSGAIAASALPAFAWSGGRASSALPDAGKPKRIILDTDPGVDDAMAFFLALRSPELKVEAVTPVEGNVPLSLTLPNALRLLEICNRGDIPVAAGSSTPLVRRLITARYAHGNNGLGGVDFPEPKLKPVNSTAAELIRKIVRSNPGEITIVAVGPLTNVATVLKEDPSIATLIKAIVMMGGSLSGGNITPAAEFNFYVDPEAARIVFDSGVPLTMVGLDVTRKVQLHEDNIKELEAAKNPVSQAAAKIMRASFDRIKKDRPNPSFAMHDPLTVAHLIDPTILTLKDYYVQIETQGEITAGESIGWEHAPVHRSPPLDTGMPAGEPADAEFKPNAKVAVEVDADKFFKLLIPRLTAPM
jgi:inosine-uridine nucleoside N-ribohydrolase